MKIKNFNCEICVCALLATNSICAKSSAEMEKIMEDYYMTSKEFCERLQISSSTVYRMIKSGMIPETKFGRRWKIPRSVFSSYDRGSKDYRQIVGGIKGIR